MNAPCSFHLRPPRLALLLLVAGAVVQWGINGPPAKSTPQIISGVVIILGGFALMLGAWGQFQRERTPVCHRATPTQLVTTGCFRFTRNPMYLGLLLMLVGIAVTAGTWPLWFPPAGFLLIVSTTFIPCEERRMTELFGEDFIRYRARVRRWI